MRASSSKAQTLLEPARRLLQNFQKWLIAVLVILSLAVGLQAIALAQFPGQMESRLSRLEFAVESLRSQVDQLASRSPQVSPSLQSRPPAQSDWLGTGPSSSARGTRLEPSMKAQWDNLTTLVIELREQVRDLEARVDALQQ